MVRVSIGAEPTELADVQTLWGTDAVGGARERNMNGRLTNKVAIVTGGGTGIGAAIARRFAQAGASVVVTGRRPEPLQAIAAEIQGVVVAGDVSTNAHVAEVIDTTISRFGGLDIVVANAAISYGTSVEDIEDEPWQHILDVNISGVMKISRAALPALKARGQGSIVVVSSVAGLSAAPESASYMTTKAAIIGLTKSMAYDYGPHNIRVNALCPGWVRTPMSEGGMDFLGQEKGISQAEAFQLATKHLPLRRHAEPDEIANCCLFLASDEASFVTGATLVADGGGEIVDVGTLAFANEDKGS